MVEFVSKEVRFCRRHRSNFLRFLFSLLSYCRTSPSTESQTIFTVHWTRLYFVLGKSIESVYRRIEGEDGRRGTKVLHEDFSRCLGKMLSDANFSIAFYRRFSGRHLHWNFFFVASLKVILVFPSQCFSIWRKLLHGKFSQNAKIENYQARECCAIIQ